MQKQNYTVYKHIFPNGKVYIGITCNDVNRRWDNGRGYRKQQIMRCAIEKFGWENIKHEILFENLNKEQAEQKEIELIAFYNSTNKKYGYNFLQGGSSNYSFTMSKKQKDKISRTLKGRKQSNKHILNASNAHKIPVMQYDLNGVFIKEFKGACEAEKETGISHTKISQCCHKKSYSASGYIWKFKKDNTDIAELVNKVKNKNGKNHYHARAVNQYTKDNKFIKHWDCISDACKFYNIGHSGIVSCCTGKNKSGYGYIWKYA